MISNHAPNSIHQPVRAGLSLVEILIALTMTLIVLGAMMSAFQYASAEMQNGRATLEMANRVRVAENLLRRDLANLTVEPRPYIDKTIPNGYFEYIEGPRRDLRAPFESNAGSTLPSTVNETSYLGDLDDVLAFTVKSIAGQSFRGRQLGVTGGAPGPTNVIESSFAEVIWWTAPGSSPDAINYTDSIALFRRVLLVNPELALPTGLPYNQALNWLAASDVSARIVKVGTTYDLVPNSLADLANRGNRFARYQNHLDGTPAIPDPAQPFQFPFPLNRGTLFRVRSSDIGATLNDISPNGTDIILTNIAGYDIKTFADDCLVATISGALLEPGDPGFHDAAVVAGVDIDADGDGLIAAADTDDSDNTIIAVDSSLGYAIRGAFVDLGHHGFGKFSQGLSPLGKHVISVPDNTVPRSPLNYQFNFHAGASNPLVLRDLLETAYDTWTPEYESDGINQDPLGNVPFNQLTGTPGVRATEDGDTNIDEGTDGIDNDGANGPDDFNERETQPPYNHPITGLKVTFRLVEKQTGQVRQSSVVHNYGAQ